MKALYIVLTVVLLAGCAASGEQLTATAGIARDQTQTAAPTLTATQTFTPTFTPRPTSTPRPTKTPEPTPAAVGETVQYNALEITLLEVVTHTQIMLSSGHGYDANTGAIFIDMTVLVRNTGSNAYRVAMEEIYIVEESDEAWYPAFGGFQTVELERRFNPMATIKFDRVFGSEVISFEKDTYLRLVFVAKENQSLLFGIEESPQFAVPVE